MAVANRSTACWPRVIAAALKLAAQLGARSIAFPAISTGVYGFPLAEATRVAVDSVRRILGEEPRLERVVFCVFGDDARHAYEAELGRGGFPPKGPSAQ